MAVGCSAGSGAVVFAPTPVPADVSPASYAHPSAAFTVVLPRTWALRERHLTVISIASFSPPRSHVPLITLAALRLNAPPADDTALQQLMTDIQTRWRPDAPRYTEITREAMGDGSWRLTGVRQTLNNTAQQINTFIEIHDGLLGVIEVVLTDDPALNQRVQEAVNTVQFHPTSDLQPTTPETLRLMSSNALEALNVSAWTAPDGAFFVTGEVANLSDIAVEGLPVEVALLTQDGRAVTSAADVTMGYGVPPGGFMPFSLRFGDGQPALTDHFTLTFGAEAWEPLSTTPFYGVGVLSWTDSFTVTPEGWLLVSGVISNPSETYVYLPRVVITVFDDNQRVIAARFVELDKVEFAPGEQAPYEVLITELGGTAARYIVTVQARG
ncbi:MAG: hypothetical protein ACOYL5_02095 [Phototrophicaceae bacterium]